MPADVANSTNMGAEDNFYKVTVEVTDGLNDGGNSDTAIDDSIDVAVTVINVDETPEITGGSATPNFPEIEYDATSPGLIVQTYTARDEENETIEWSLDGTDMGDFSINSSTGVLSFAQRPNYEMPDDDGTNNVYDIIAKATYRDSSVPNKTNTTENPVTVTVTDVNERPDITKVTDDELDYAEVDFYFTITPTERQANVHTFTATNYDGDTFEWSLSGDDAGDFDIDSSSGALTFVQNDALMVGPLPSFKNPQD